MDWSLFSYLLGVATPLIVLVTIAAVRVVRKAFRTHKELKGLWGGRG